MEAVRSQGRRGAKQAAKRTPIYPHADARYSIMLKRLLGMLASLTESAQPWRNPTPWATTPIRGVHDDGWVDMYADYRVAPQLAGRDLRVGFWLPSVPHAPTTKRVRVHLGEHAREIEVVRDHEVLVDLPVPANPLDCVLSLAVDSPEPSPNGDIRKLGVKITTLEPLGRHQPSPDQSAERASLNQTTAVPTVEQTMSRALTASPKYRRQQANGEVQISLVMPTFNRAHVLARTVRSIFENLSGISFELIIIDDGSTDDTQTVLADLAAQYRGITHRREDHGGPGRARNLGAELATAELLVFIGDDTSVIDRSFLAAHWLAHDRYPESNKAVVGKIRWSDQASHAPNFVMTHIQGNGQQQFGFAHMAAYSWYDWQLFYSSNVSLKKNVVSDWQTDGFSDQFYFAAMEDAEFAYRMHTRHGSFDILYVPAAVLVHDHPYSLESFITRQRRAGMMAQVFLEAHPEVSERLGLSTLQNILATKNIDAQQLPLEHYMNVVEGLKSWSVILDQQTVLGSQNWHADLLDAIFRLAYQEGFLSALSDPELDYCSAYRFILDEFRESTKAMLFAEALDRRLSLQLV